VFWVKWVLATTVALVVGWAMVGAAVAVLFVVTWDWDPGVVVGLGVWVVAVVGAVLGTAQWIILRRRVYQSGWWLLASTVGCAVGLAVGDAVLGAMGLPVGLAVGEFVLGAVLEAVGYVVGGAVVGAVLGALVGAVVGAIAGIALVWLLRHPIPEA